MFLASWPSARRGILRVRDRPRSMAPTDPRWRRVEQRRLVEDRPNLMLGVPGGLGDRQVDAFGAACVPDRSIETRLSIRDHQLRDARRRPAPGSAGWGSRPRPLGARRRAAGGPLRRDGGPIGGASWRCGGDRRCGPGVRGAGRTARASPWDRGCRTAPGRTRGPARRRRPRRSAARRWRPPWPLAGRLRPPPGRFAGARCPGGTGSRRAESAPRGGEPRPGHRRQHRRRPAGRVRDRASPE